MLITGFRWRAVAPKSVPNPAPPSLLPPSPPARKHGGGVSVPEAGTLGVG